MNPHEPAPAPARSSAEPVVITAAGVVGSFGIGLEPLAAGLAAGVPRSSPIDHLAGLPPRGSRGRGATPAVTVAALADESGADAWLSAREARRMSPPSRFAVVASRMALAGAAGSEPDAAAGPDDPALPGLAGEPDPRLAVVLATTYGASSFTQRLLDQAIDESPEAMSPYLFMESVANAPAGQVAIHCRAGGPNETLCQREAGPVSALGRAGALLTDGRADRVLAGAVEEVTPLLFSVLDRFRALSALPRPFDARRDGFLLGEGSTVLRVERERAVRARGGRPLARLVAWGGMFDPTASRNDWGTGAARLARSLARGIERFGLAVGEIDAVVSGASGALRGDRLEAGVLQALFAPRPVPPVSIPKAVTGEYGGACLAAALLALAGLPAGQAAPDFVPDPDLALHPVADAPGVAPRRVLVTGLAAGGSGAWVILDAPDREANP